ncbi:MAG: glycosyltransferase [Microbacterium sp.]
MGERILFVSHTHAFGSFRVGSHHYARVLARRGADVVHLSTPISLAHRLTGRVGRAADAAAPRAPVRDDDGVRHLVPRTTLPCPYGRFRAARELSHHGIDPAFDLVLIDQPLLWDASLRPLARRLVYRPTDLYPTGVKARLQREIVAACDGVVATSSEVLRALGPVGIPALVLPNGVDAARFAGSDAGPLRPAVCIYVGAFDARFDGAQIAAWARTHPEARFVLAGEGTLSGSFPANVDLLGAVPYEALPTLLRGARVGLLPLSDDPVNAGRSPMKLYEYLAAGLAVVARETPVIRADHDAGLFSYIGADDADAALGRALAHRSPNSEGAQRAAGQSWETKTDALVAFVEALTGR